MSNIDVWAKINDEYFIAIEDKTNTGEHSKQLERYKEIAIKYCKDNSLKPDPVLVYLKTGNESLASMNKVKEKDYSVITRKTFLEVLKKRPIANDVFNDFKDYLIEIEYETNLCDKLENITSIWRAGQGFYLKLQKHITESTDWDYVPNPTGGFLGFWLHWNATSQIGEIYIQIENSFERGIKLVIKICDWEQSTETLYRILGEITPIAEKNGLTIEKPGRFSPGWSATVAIVQNAFQIDDNGNLDFNKFLTTLKQLAKTIDEYCEQSS